MNLAKTLAATAAISLLPAAAMAADAVATSGVHVRAGPGTNYQVVDTLHAGERVDVDRCDRGYDWCRVSHYGPDGWVSARYLSDARYARGRRPLNQYGVALNIPALGFQFGIGSNGAYAGPSYYPGYPNRDRDRDRNGRNDRNRMAQVCFYEDFNYKGDRFCAHPGQADNALRGHWNDRISSIRIEGDAKVRVCEDYNYRGRCHTVTSNDSALRGRNNDIISSYRVSNG